MVRGACCVALAGIVFLLVGASTAGAAVYCVHQNPDPCAGEIDQGADLQAALTAAAGSGGDDDVNVRAGTYSGPFSYAGGSAVHIAGVGATTILQAPSADGTTVIDINSPMSTIDDLHIDVPLGNSTVQNRGLSTNGAADGVSATIPASPTFHMAGVVLSSGGSFRHGSVLGPMPAVPGPSITGIATSGDPTIEDTTSHADTALSLSGGGTVRRVDAQGRVGFNLQSETTSGGSGNFLIEDSLWRTGPGATTGFGVFAGCGFSVDFQGTVRNMTLLDNTGGGEPVAMICNVMGRSATMDLSSTIAQGGASSLAAFGNNGPATINVSYSDYDPAMVLETGMAGGAVNEGAGNVNVAPGFVSATDFHLAAGSPLIDIGDPAVPGVTELDLDGGARAKDGTFDCNTAARRDIGAYEFGGPGLKDCIAPDTTIKGPSKVRTRKKRARVSFTLGASEAGASFQCSVDGTAFVPCTSPFSARLRRGRHTVTARAADALGNVDTSPASVATKVKPRKPPSH